MVSMKKVAPIAAFASVLTLGGCTTDGYGYGGVNVGYGSGYYYDGYPNGPYAPYGWYDDYYYPGSGYWLYDRYGARHRWTERQRRYWEQRREHRGKWDGPSTRPWRSEMRDEQRRVDRDRRWDSHHKRDGEQLQRVPRERGAATPRSPQTSPDQPQRIPRRND